MEFGDRDVESDGFDLRGCEHNAHVLSRTLPFLSRTINVPAAAHEHVGQKNEVARKPYLHPFPDRSHLLNAPAGNGLIIMDTLKFR
jgi:hypothetical protein